MYWQLRAQGLGVQALLYQGACLGLQDATANCTGGIARKLCQAAQTGIQASCVKSERLMHQLRTGQNHSTKENLRFGNQGQGPVRGLILQRSEEHTSEL